MTVTIITRNADGSETVKKIDDPKLEIAANKLKEAFEGLDWCNCGDEHTFGSYPEDGECSCGVYKHHVHCGTCGKIQQVG